MIESDLFKKIEKKKREIEMTKSTRVIEFPNSVVSQKKISTSRRGSRVGKPDPKYFSINKSIKMLSQRHIPKNKRSHEQKNFHLNYSRKKLTSIESKSSRQILSSKNIASIELPETKAPMSRVVSKDFNAFQTEIEEIEEVESVEENLEMGQKDSEESHEIGKEEEEKEKHKSFKKELRKRLEEILGEEEEQMRKLKEEIPQKFKYWKKNDLVEIYNFKTNIGFFEIEKRIGKGSFGKVYLARQVLTGAKVALKVISKKSLKQKNAEQRIQKEISILKKIPAHPNIIRLLEIFNDADYHYLVFEFAPLGDLVSYFFKEDLFPEEKLKRFFGQFLEGLRHIHTSGVIHRDIKPDNILMDEQFNPKIADFGISNIFKEGEVIEDTGGTPLYLSPEVIENEGKIGFQTDVWSAGIVLYLLVFGDTPFKGRNMNELFLQILSKEVRFDIANDFNDDQSLVQDLIRKMLAKRPEDRITLHQIKQHVWLKPSSRPLRKSCLSNSEHEEETVDLYKELGVKSGAKQRDSRMINSCRNIGNYSWAISSNRQDITAFGEQSSDIYQMQEVETAKKKFVANTSTHNTNQNSPVSRQNPGYQEAFSGVQFREMMVREVILEHLESFGFPKEYLLQSVSPENKIFNHVRGCFENLLMIL